VLYAFESDENVGEVLDAGGTAVDDQHFKAGVMTEVQHEHHDLVVSTSHAHLDHDSCLEVLIVHGSAARVQHFADILIGLKGVQHGRLVMTVPSLDAGHERPHTHTHDHPHEHSH